MEKIKKKPQSGSLDDLIKKKKDNKSHGLFSLLFGTHSKPSSPVMYHVKTNEYHSQQRIMKVKGESLHYSKEQTTTVIKNEKEVQNIEETTQLTKEHLKERYYDYLMSLNEEEIYQLIRYIPMRLTEKERGYLDVLEAALDVSEYTNNVDIAKSDYEYYGYYCGKRDISVNEIKKEELIIKEHNEFKSTLLGILVTNNLKEGLKILKDKTLEEVFMQDCFEVGRRYKAANPSMMRETYQKMMHILQDAINYNPKFIGKEFVKNKNWKPIYTVEMGMKECNMKIEDIMKCIKLREEGLTLEEIEKQYGEHGLRIVYSIRDGIEASAKTCGVVFGMLKQLERFRDKENTTLSLEIQFGKDGSRLTQSHSEHFLFVQQSLRLWWNVMRHMSLLWIMNDKDFLSGRSYSLVNTGQGLQRLQQCPNVSSAIHQILSQTQSTMCEGKEWRGLSVVHLGDRDVPNCLFFIDKYSQVPWILSPVLRTTRRMFSHKELKRVPTYFETYSSRNWGRCILQHFFQHAFDGSGSDGGSCIDGRLTSAWNWCSMIEKYSYYPLFLLCDFEGFEGPYKK
ncbi:hypothetical protein conserved [Entamoeba histolytica]|uniref:Non-canonical E2 ubiquitin-conjugating enzyme C-terminal domain-containing protein n=3 Tax=Entamoeba histolytica TaxID=5759 RepID=C4LXI6_ENTH1|nr:hypothetical protein, conserved [Entamoeba histolytica HM-1:IMSS]EAL50142.1 hypothetical protein, conserved [Entamoeba histolytica HM-1:IMSS]EMD49627.1 Hypothetical protein EHI5A_206340 [Entamoeba histolytica KU27]GAT93466.1 hypothetical protein conserved [Entamoeba histolytica]|eukprot:XP_655531.1 hypothetical protein, conserved [Entamoeba histolytica HM-1:IMSS]